MSNGAGEPYDVTASVVPDEPTGVRLQYANGTVRQRPVSGLTGVSPAQLTNVTDVQLVGANVTSESWRVPADSGIGTSIGDVEPGASVWLVVRRTTGESRILAWAQVSCRPGTAVTRGDVTIAADGTIAVATECLATAGESR